MTDKDAIQGTAEILGARTTVTFEELCLACRVDADWVGQLIDEGVIEPIGAAQREWHFASASIVRVAKAKRLHRDLSINAPGLALALDLLDQIEELRVRLKSAQAEANASTEAR